VPRRHHLRVEEQVPGRERGPAHQRDGRRALRQGAPDDEGGPRHHHPGERHDHRHARHLGAQRPRVAVEPERHAGVQAQGLDHEAAAAGHHSNAATPRRPCTRAASASDATANTATDSIVTGVRAAVGTSG